MTPPLPSSAPGRFATTRWSVVLRASDPDTPRARVALSELCGMYWFPLYAYARRRGYSPPDAEDLTQGFFARLLRLHSLATVRPERGKFRAFLLAGMKHYLADEHDRASAQKRAADRTLPLDPALAEHRYHAEASDTLSPERLFDRQWALALLETVLARLRAEAEAAGRGAWFEAVRFSLTGERQAHAALASSLGTTPEALRVAIHRLRKRYRQLLREEIAQTVSDASLVEEELATLRRILSA